MNADRDAFEGKEFEVRKPWKFYYEKRKGKAKSEGGDLGGGAMAGVGGRRWSRSRLIRFEKFSRNIIGAKKVGKTSKYFSQTAKGSQKVNFVIEKSNYSNISH